MSNHAQDRYRVAAIQFEPVLGAKADNLQRLLALVETAAQGGARLIVLPEMATTGYCWYDRDEVRPYVEPIPGPTTAAFAALAATYGCYIVVGMPEAPPGSSSFYNSAALIGPAGVVSVYRKTHSFVADQTWAKDGDLGFPVWDTPLGRIGILICMDAGYFEPARLLALAGADVLCFPTNWLGERSPGPAWITRAYENGCYLIGANRYGLERGVQFSGGSCVLNPDGTIQAQQQTGDGVVFGEVSIAAARAKMLPPRQPQLYDTLTLNRYLGHPAEYHGLYGRRPLPPGRRSRVAVVQCAAVAGDVAGNIARIERSVLELCGPAGERSSADTIALAVFPEYTLTGQPAAGGAAAGLTAAAADEWLPRLGALAQRYAVHLVVGYLEREGAACFSAAVLVGPEGVVARYRKAHVPSGEAAWCTPGTARPPVVDLPLGRVGLLLGTDLCVPEAVRCLAVEGCDLIAVPAADGLPATFALDPPDGTVAQHPAERHHFHLARQRAFENNCYIALATPPAPAGLGVSGLFGPDAADRAAEVILETSGAAVGVVDTADVARPYPSVAPSRLKELVRMRQPHLYEPLQLPGS